MRQGHAGRVPRRSPRTPPGTSRRTSTYGVVGDPVADGGGGGGVGPVTQPDNVSRPRQPQHRDGLPGRLAARTCDQAQLALDPQGRDLEGHVHHPGRRAVRVQGRDQQDRGTRTTARAACRTAATSPTRARRHAGDVLLRPRARTRSPATPQGPIITAPGSFQSELGLRRRTGHPTACGPGCRTPTATARYTWSQRPRSRPATTSSRSPHGPAAGTRTTATAAARTAPTSRSACPADGLVVTISYVLATHVVTTTTVRGRRRARPDQGARPSGSSRDLVAWPATRSRRAPTRRCCAGGCTGRRTAASPSTPRPSPAAPSARPDLRPRRAAGLGRRRSIPS